MRIVSVHYIWERDDAVTIKEVKYFNDASHVFDIYVHGHYMTTITPSDSAHMLEMRNALDAGESVLDWEDDDGNTISNHMARMRDMDGDANVLHLNTTLTKRQAQVYVMRFKYGMSAKDVAEALGITAGTVYRTSQDATAKIHRYHPEFR